METTGPSLNKVAHSSCQYSFLPREYISTNDKNTLEVEEAMINA